MPRLTSIVGVGHGRLRAVLAAVAAGSAVAAMSLAVVPGASATVTAPRGKTGSYLVFRSAASHARHAKGAKPEVSSGGSTVAYFDQWSIYANNYYVKDLQSSGVINHINYLLYDFVNISPTAPYQCLESEHATDPDPGGENDPNAGDGAGDMDADYGKDFTAAQSVNGQADTFGQFAGNFHQLQELKALHPNLKILMSIGGWTYSKYFSDAAATASSRQAFVSSCINMFLKGTGLPSDADYGVTPTAADMSGLFDGFDIDWEYPGSTGGHLGNHESSADTANYTALLGEFRSELNTLGSQTGKTYYLSAALPSGQDKISKVQTSQIGQYLNFGDLMAYDMHGGFEPTGPTNFQDPLFNDPADPSPVVAPGNEHYSVTNAVNAWVNGDSAYGIAGGFPASKLNLGMPLYYRDWSGVPAGSNHGLYQTATGPGPDGTYSGDVPGVQMYKELTSGPFSAGEDVVDNPADTFYDAAAGAAYFYDGTNFWTGLSPQSVTADINFMHCEGMGGVMMFSMYDQDPSNPVLFNDIENALGTSPGSCSTPSSFSMSVSPSSASVTAGGSVTATVATALTSGSSQTVALSASGAPGGATVSLSPTSVTTGGSSTMTVTTSSSTAAGTYSITVTGKGSASSSTATYALTVTGSGGGNGFSVAVSPSSATVAPGGSTTATVSTTLTSGSAQTVALSAAGKPTGVSSSFSPKSVTVGGSSKLTLKVKSTVATGTYTITIKAKATSGTQTATFSLTVGSGGGGGGGSLTNAGFETGSLSPWTCQPGDAVVGSPVHSGSHAAQVTATASQTGECDQTVTLSPNTSYTLTGWVEGNFAYIGVTGGASASTWTSSSGWSQLTVPFTTGSSGSVTVFVHGWYSEGNVYADDFNLTTG